MPRIKKLRYCPGTHAQLLLDACTLVDRYRALYGWDKDDVIPDVQVLAQLVFDLMENTPIGEEYEFVPVYEMTEENCEKSWQEVAEKYQREATARRMLKRTRKMDL